MENTQLLLSVSLFVPSITMPLSTLTEPPPHSMLRKFVRKSGPDTSHNQKTFYRPIRDPRLRRLNKGYVHDIYMQNWKEPHTHREHIHTKIPVNNFRLMYLRHVHGHGKIGFTKIMNKLDNLSSMERSWTEMHY